QFYIKVSTDNLLTVISQNINRNRCFMGRIDTSSKYLRYARTNILFLMMSFWLIAGLANAQTLSSLHAKADKGIKRDDINTNVKTEAFAESSISGLSYKYLKTNTGNTGIKNPLETLRVSGLQEEINGTVSDAKTGEPLPGGNILVKETTTGASTGAEGEIGRAADRDR